MRVASWKWFRATVSHQVPPSLMKITSSAWSIPHRTANSHRLRPNRLGAAPDDSTRFCYGRLPSPPPPPALHLLEVHPFFPLPPLPIPRRIHPPVATDIQPFRTRQRLFRQ